MNITEYAYECSLQNPKYQYKNVDAYGFLMNNFNRMIQLTTVAKLTTDNDSMLKDFPIDYDYYGFEPYSDYVIKVNDTEDLSLYIFVHYEPTKTYLFPVCLGFKSGFSCSPLDFTDNWRAREIRGAGNDMFSQFIEDMGFVSIKDSYNKFGLSGRMLEVDNHNIYGKVVVLANSFETDLLTVWKKQEYNSVHNNYQVTSPSSTALVIQIWLYTICMWRKRCLNFQVRVVQSNNKYEYTSDIRSYMNSSKHIIVDINKDIVVYVNKNMSKREFRGYHIRKSHRCGHFRHLRSGSIVYIPPTTVYYKKLVPDITCDDARFLVYRNKEDFLKLKSYLENDVSLMLKAKSISYESEKMFDWMGRKRLDFYLPDSKIAIECQGVQHFYPYGSKDVDFENRQKRDADKHLECIEHDIIIVYYVNPDIPIPMDMLSKYIYVSNLDDLYNLIK